MKRLLLLAYLSLILQYGWSQQDLRIGEWEAHLPYRTSTWVTQSNDYVYANTGNALMKINKLDLRDGNLLSPTYFSKIDGLSESQIDKVKYDPFNEQLIIAYSSSNLDFISGDEIVNIPYIKDNGVIIGSRAINDIVVTDASNAYIAGAFGLINVDLQKLEFRYTTFTPSSVQSVTVDDSYIYIGLETGMYKISKDDINPIDFSRWSFVGTDSGLPMEYDCSQLVYHYGSVYAAIEGGLYREVDGTYVKLDIEQPSGYKIQFMTAESQRLVLGLTNRSISRSTVRVLNADNSYITGGADCIFKVIYGIEDQYGQMWYADEFRGFRTTAGVDYGCRVLEFDSPRELSCSHIEVGDGKVFFASGGASDNYALLSNRGGIYILEENTWNNVNETRYPEINAKEYLNFVSVAPHPDENKVFVASYYSGLMEYDLDTEEIIFYGKDNSKIDGILPTDRAGRVAFAVFDDDDNLWMSNFGAARPIVVYTKDGNWHNFDIPINNKNLAKMVVDNSGYIWFTLIGNNGGVVVYDPGERIADPTDDRIKLLNEFNSEIPSPLVNSLAVDLDGDVWVGTSQGPVIFDCDVFGDNCIGSRRKVLEDNIPAILLETEEILCIEVDGANRKWIGTKNGIFVQSADGDTQEERYTEDNSPLFDNTIQDMDYDEKEGRMYIATDQGVQSIRTGATGARRVHNESQIYAFPNPVRPNYNGPIAINGLGRNAVVKITDINGKLVYETDALGGQALWDGNDYSGRRAAAGVYLVFSTSKVSFDTPDSYVTKIMILD